MITVGGWKASLPASHNTRSRYLLHCNSYTTAIILYKLTNNMMLSLLLSLNAHSHIFRNAEISSKKICRCRRRNSMAYQQCGSSKCKILATVVAMCNYRVSLIIFAITLSSASQFCGHVVIAMAADCITNVNFGFKPLATELGIYAAKNNLCPWIIFLPRDAMQSAVMRLYNVCLFVTLRYVKKID